MEAHALLNRQREFFNTGATKSVEYRKQALDTLRVALHAYEDRLFAALQQDLQKAELETFITELGLVFNELAFARKNVGKWAKKKRQKMSLAVLPASCATYSEPYGSVLIIAPWNYPLLLCFVPLVGALAAGNCAVIKPSELAPAVSQVIADMVAEYFEDQFVAVMQGGRECATELLAEPFDFIFYTGSEAVGKIVMQAAAQHLTPVCLELGGKSPCIVDETANLRLAAKRIASGKIINAGQTCVAPDYLFVQEAVAEELQQYLIEYIQQFLGDSPLTNPDYPSIINERHMERLLGLMHAGTIVFGGRHEGRHIEPTLLRNVPDDAPIMQHEIFGPLLPIFTYRQLDEVVRFIKSRPKPLALYYFTENKKTARRILSEISFGGGCINDTLMQVVAHTAPFGGVGTSGMGRYHGKYSFELFSHKKTILTQPTWVDLPQRYHPYKKVVLYILRKILN